MFNIIIVTALPPFCLIDIENEETMQHKPPYRTFNKTNHISDCLSQGCILGVFFFSGK